MTSIEMTSREILSPREVARYLAPASLSKRATSMVRNVAAAEMFAKAALASCGIEEELSYGTMLLADIRSVFEEKDCGRMNSADLAAALVVMTDRPWGECNHGKALTQIQLARRLKPFGIGPKTVRADGDRLKGYLL